MRDVRVSRLATTALVFSNFKHFMIPKRPIQGRLRTLQAMTASSCGFEEVKGLDFRINVAVFVGVDDATKADIFSTVNLAQTKVNKSLVYDLFSLQKSRSSEKTCHEIVVALDEMEESPFYQRIKQLGSATDGRFGETLSQATVVRGLLPYITDDALTDRDIGKRFGFRDRTSPDEAKNESFALSSRNNRTRKYWQTC